MAEELDAVRKLVLEEHSDLTLTSLYNVLHDLTSGAALSKKSEDIKGRGRVLILKDLHEQIDAAVGRAYGWSPDLSDDEVLDRLVALNAERAAEERRGFVRWLRPDYQIERLGPLAHRADRIQSIAVSTSSKSKKQAFPAERKAQAGQVILLLDRSRGPLTAEQIAAQFKDADQIASDVGDVLKSLSRLGEVETFDNGRSFVRTAS